MSSYDRAYYLKNRDKLLERKRQWHKANRHRACAAAKLRQYKKYGLTKQDYDRMCAQQDNKCAICFQLSKLVIDHDHSTDALRQLLCNSCNIGLGAFKDNPDRLRVAASYLTKFR